MIEKIAKLLALAEATKNEAEAAAYMEKAQALATLNAIDLAKARSLDPAKKKSSVPVQRRITLGESGTRGLNTYIELFDGIGRANDVKCNIAHNSTYVIAFGFPEDIDATETLFRSLLVQMVTASQEYRKTGEWKKDTVYRPSEYVNYDRNNKRCGAYRSVREVYIPGGYRPVTWLTARLEFQEAYAYRISSRLRDAKNKAEAEAKAADAAAAALIPVADNVGAAAPGTELVLKAKREEVDLFYKETSRARGHWKGGYTSKGAATSRAAGGAAANNARLSGQKTLGGSKRALN